MGTYTGRDKRLQYLFQNGGGGGGGGTNVEANPQGTPTAYLNTIKISNSIYSVEKPADIYSTEEKQVGVWIDGRPIYKRTYDLGSDVSVSYNSWTTLNNVVIPNLNFIVKGYGTNAGGTYTPLQTTWVVSTHAIQIQTPRNNYAQNVRYFTIFYCKDNDSAGSGIWTPQGSYAVHYSTDEQIIGTYLGKTLYRKAFVLSANYGNVAGSTWKAIPDIDDSNMEIVISCKYIYSDTASIYVNYELTASTNRTYFNNQLAIMHFRNTSIGFTAGNVIIVEYTKIND